MTPRCSAPTATWPGSTRWPRRSWRRRSVGGGQPGARRRGRRCRSRSRGRRRARAGRAWTNSRSPRTRSRPSEPRVEEPSPARRHRSTTRDRRGGRRHETCVDRGRRALAAAPRGAGGRSRAELLDELYAPSRRRGPRGVGPLGRPGARDGRADRVHRRDRAARVPVQPERRRGRRPHRASATACRPWCRPRRRPAPPTARRPSRRPPRRRRP